MSSFYSGKFSFNKITSPNCSRGRKTDLDHKAHCGAPCPNWMQFLISKTEQHFSRHICGLHVTQENPWTPSHLVVPTEVLMSPETHHLPEPFVDEIILRLLLLTPYWGEGFTYVLQVDDSQGQRGVLLWEEWRQHWTAFTFFLTQEVNLDCRFLDPG